MLKVIILDLLHGNHDKLVALLEWGKLGIEDSVIKIQYNISYLKDVGDIKLVWIK